LLVLRAILKNTVRKDNRYGDMASGDKNIHKNHRNRIRERFINHGLDSFEDYQVLELLLFYSIPRIDVNELAHRLINTFGSLHSVFDAPLEELKKVQGVGDNTAILLKLIPQLWRRYLISRENASGRVILSGSADAGRYIIPYFHSQRDEVVYIICLDNANRVISCKPLFKGNLNTAAVSTRKLVEHALRENAAGIIMAHNHLSGSTEPSKADVETTVAIARALRTVEIRLIDHIIVAGDAYSSILSVTDIGAIR
jgi:DNA repair protein RadC